MTKKDMILPEHSHNKFTGLWDKKAQASREYITNFRGKNTITISVPLHRWIGVAFIADMHLGSDGVDYDRARRDAEEIGRRDDMFAILGGDGIDNFITPKIISALIDSSSNPAQELALLDEYVGFFNDSILAMISGNHEDWSYALSGIDCLEGIAKKHRILYSKADYHITLKFDKVSYRLYIRHKYRFNSSYNLTHAVKQMLRMSSYTFDIGVIGHHHEAAVEFFIWKDRYRLAIRNGSYKIADGHSRKEGYNGATCIMPAVAFSPFSRVMVPFMSITECADYVKMKNNA